MRSREFIQENPLSTVLRTPGAIARAADSAAGTAKLTKTFTKWTPEMEAELRKLYAEGVTTSRIAQHFGIPEPAVKNKIQKLKKSGTWNLENRNIKWTTKMEAELKQLWNQNYPAEDIAQRLGITDVRQVLSKATRLRLPSRGRAAIRFRAQGYQSFSGKTFSEILSLGGFKLTSKNKTSNSLNLSSRNSQQFLKWLDTEFLPTLEGKQLFDRLVAFDTKMLRANHIRHQNNLVIINRANDSTNRYSYYKWNEVDEKSTITKRELSALQSEFKQITDELRKLARHNIALKSRLDSNKGFGFIPMDKWPTTNKLDTYENWRKTQRLYYPEFLDQLDQFEDTVNQLAIAQGVVTDANYARFSILSKIQKLGNPPDLINKYRELKTKFTDIRILAGADLKKLKSQLPAWHLAELSAVDKFRNMSYFKSSTIDAGRWNIDHVGVDSRKIDIHFLLDNRVVGGAEVKGSWDAHFGSLKIPMHIDRSTGAVTIDEVNQASKLADDAQKLIKYQIDQKMLDRSILDQLKISRHSTRDLTKIIDVSTYVKDYYSKKDQGRATFLVVGDEIYRLTDQIPETLTDFPGLDKMQGIEGMRGKLRLISRIDSRGRIWHQVGIRGLRKQEINSIKLDDLEK